MEPQRVQTTRIRTFFEFETPRLINCTEERTIYYDGPEVTSFVQPSRQFRPHLSVKDCNGEILQFHGHLEDYFNVDYEGEVPERLPEREGGQEIVIDFPQNRPLREQSFRTFSYNFKIELPLDLGDNVQLLVPLEAYHNYVYIRKMEQFQTVIDYLIQTKDGNYFEIDDLQERDQVQISEEASYFTIQISELVPECTLAIYVGYKLETKDRLWFNAGLMIASVTAVSNYFLLASNSHTNTTLVATLAGVANTYLIVTKGWIFTKDLDKTLGVEILDADNIPISYTLLYLFFIVVLFVEIIVAAYLFFTIPVSAS